MRILAASFGLVLTIVAGMTLAPREASAQACPPPAPVATSAQVVAWLDCTLVELEAVWRENVRTAVRDTHPRAGVSRLDLAYVSDCDFSPRLEDLDGDGRPEIVLNTRLLIPQLMLSQAILWYVVAPEGTTTPSDHLDYLDDVLLPAVRRDKRRCSRENARGRYSAVAIPSVFAANPGQHGTFLSLDSPATRAVGDHIGALPTFFATLHEAGHAALHLGEGAAAGIAKELEADGFAAEVFEANDVPLTLGLGFFLLAYDLDRAGPSADIACRIVALAEAAERSDPRAAPELGARVRSRTGSLREAYLARYARRCDRA